jgi:endonuclease YncB( thermonuclease family)
MKRLRLGVLLILYLLILFTLFTKSFVLFRVEYEITSKPIRIIDGDTFEIPNEPTIRLADIDCPEGYEPGGPEATFALTQLIGDKTIFLDVDNVHRFDASGERYVCVVYVSYNSTHLLNVNKALLVLGQAEIVDYDNQWDPYMWSLYVAKPSNETVFKYLGASAAISLIFVIGVNLTISRINRKIFGKKKDSELNDIKSNSENC